MMCAISVSISFAQVNNARNAAQAPEPKETISFDKTDHDFGSISATGGAVECEFTLENTGDKPLIITSVTAGCGCTATDFTKEPIAPGKKGVVKASYDPRGASSGTPINKYVTVFTNANPARKQLNLKGTIK